MKDTSNYDLFRVTNALRESDVYGAAMFYLFFFLSLASQTLRSRFNPILEILWRVIVYYLLVCKEFEFAYGSESMMYPVIQ